MSSRPRAGTATVVGHEVWLRRRRFVATASDALSAAQDRISAGGVVSLAIGLAATAAGAQTALYLVNVYALSQRVDLLNVDGETTLAAWAGTVAVFATALLCLLLAVPSRTSRRMLLGIAAATALFSIDDALALHERIARTATTTLGVQVEWGRLLWPAIYLPLLLWTATALVRLARRQASQVRHLLVAGLAALAAAVALEVFSAGLLEVADFARTDWPMVLEMAVEEAAELVGWMLVATALGTILLRPLLRNEEA